MAKVKANKTGFYHVKDKNGEVQSLGRVYAGTVFEMSEVDENGIYIEGHPYAGKKCMWVDHVDTVDGHNVDPKVVAAVLSGKNPQAFMKADAPKKGRRSQAS